MTIYEPVFIHSPKYILQFAHICLKSKIAILLIPALSSKCI